MEATKEPQLRESLCCACRAPSAQGQQGRLGCGGSQSQQGRGDVVDNHHVSLRRFTGMKRLCAIVDFIFSPLRPAFGLGSPKQFSLLIVCHWSRSDSIEGSYSMQNKTGKENNVQLLGAGGVLRELHCSTSSHGAQETQDRAALAGGGC